MAEITVVDWLKNQLPSLFENDTNGFYTKMFEKAEKIYSKQIIDAWEDGAQSEHRAHVNGKADNSSLDYYTQTFKP
jgi:hypothetical protein